MDLEACLPHDLRGPATTITRIAVGLSGAGVYRVDAAGVAYVLKVSAADEPVAAWRRRVGIERRAADAGLAPAVVHVDEPGRAVLSAFVVDRSFPAFYGDPRTHVAAVTQLGQTLRRVHDLPLPADAPAVDPRAVLAELAAGLRGGAAVPAFVDEAIARVQAEVDPVDDRAAVLGHNDVNPTNLIYDGASILLLDWHTAGPTHPFFDLAAIAVFLRMDDATCRRLLAAHDGAPVDALPPRFASTLRLVAALVGATFLRLARQRQHPGATGDETVATTPPLAEVYRRLRAGELDVASAAGQWTFGLALLKDSLAR